ncbi:MAG TPA: hypothetical protein VIK06_08260 [Candidatus Limnocylindrales bacterium]|jgi:hypothetical protein
MWRTLVTERSRLLGAVAALAIVATTIPGAVAMPGPAANQVWSFGVMDDTQWTTTDPANANPNAVSVSIINQINPQFIKAASSS